MILYWNHIKIMTLYKSILQEYHLFSICQNISNTRSMALIYVTQWMSPHHLRTSTTTVEDQQLFLGVLRWNFLNWNMLLNDKLKKSILTNIANVVQLSVPSEKKRKSTHQVHRLYLRQLEQLIWQNCRSATYTLFPNP